MKRFVLVIVIVAIVMFAFGSWATPVTSASGVRTDARAPHHARLLRVRRKHRRKHPHYKHHRRPRARHRSV